MAYYRCVAIGENFRFREGGSINLLGFSTVRWVEAAAPLEAEELVISQLRNEPKLAHPAWYDGGEPHPTVHIEEIQEVSRSDIGKPTGFVFFPMKR